MYQLMAGFNVLLFNYRGVSGSTGQLTQQGTILDGMAVVEVLHCSERSVVDLVACSM